MAHVIITMYNSLGQQVSTLVNPEYQAGFHTVNWDGTNTAGQHISAGCTSIGSSLASTSTRGRWHSSDRFGLTIVLLASE